MEEKLQKYILHLEKDARTQERLGDSEAVYLIKDIKCDLEEILGGHTNDYK